MSLLLMIALHACPPLARRALGQDHLAPEMGTVNGIDAIREYDTIIRIHLIKNQEDDYLARMACLPSFFPEWVVTVWKNEKKACWIELSLAEEGFWEEKEPAKIKVKRMVAPIDGATAALLHSLWVKMLLTVKYPDDDMDNSTDGVSYHFSCREPGRGVLTGRIHAPEKGTLTAQLTELGELLREYVESPEAKRKERISRIAEKVKRIEKGLAKAGKKTG